MSCNIEVMTSSSQAKIQYPKEEEFLWQITKGRTGLFSNIGTILMQIRIFVF
jgi:hypothetical protein